MNIPCDLIEKCFTIHIINYRTINNLKCVCKEFRHVLKSDIRDFFVKKRILREMRERFKRKRYQKFMKRFHTNVDSIPLWPPSFSS